MAAGGILRSRAVAVVHRAGREIGTRDARILNDKHESKGGAKPVRGHELTGQRPHDRRNQGEADAEEDGGNP